MLRAVQFLDLNLGQLNLALLVELHPELVVKDMCGHCTLSWRCRTCVVTAP